MICPKSPGFFSPSPHFFPPNPVFSPLPHSFAPNPVLCPQSRYEQSEWGWKEREKREELRDERAWYLLAREAGAGPVAFSHFRFDVECGDEVLYW